MPLTRVFSGANRTDMQKLADLFDAVVLPALSEPSEPSERHPCLDRGDDYAACRQTATAHGYVSYIPPKASAAQPLPPPSDPDCHPPRR